MVTTTANTSSVLLFDANSTRSSLLNRSLIEFGYNVVTRLTDVLDLVACVETQKPDILVVGIDLPDDVTIQQLALLNEKSPLPVVMFAEKDTPQIIQKVVKSGVSAFVVDDIQPQRLPSIITVAVTRFNEQELLRKELDKTKNKLAERKLLEKAKGMLMKHKDVSEQEAFDTLRKMAMDKGQTLSVVASNVIDVLDLVGGSETSSI